ncbi:uncharacterized protein [Phyllobates terribilis]|uniref:uncharacterized protein n=1 Tax=Phyllobates terribilis TaxID=111132 RepID=UPI003CCB1FCD
MKELQNINKKLEGLDSLHAQYAKNAPRPHGQLPGQTEANPKGHINVVSLRSGRPLEDPKVVDLKKKGVAIDDPEEAKVQEKEEKEEPKYVPPPTYKPPLPFPQRRAQAQLEHQFGKFVEVLKKLCINIPFTEALKQMPTYVKFLKEILSNKRNLDEYHTIDLNQECSAIIQNKLPPKLEDPGSFSVPMVIGRSTYQALCDFGAIVSIIPLSICKKLDLGEPRPVKMTLLMADRSTTRPVGILEDIPIQIGKFYIPVDFIVLDIPADSPIPIIVGRPFLATAGALIDVKQGVLSFNIGEEKMEFNLPKVVKQPSFEDDVYSLDVVEKATQESLMAILIDDPLEYCLIESVTGADNLELLDDVLLEFESGNEVHETVFETLSGEDVSPMEETQEAPKVKLKTLPSNLRLKEDLDPRDSGHLLRLPNEGRFSLKGRPPPKPPSQK